MSRFWVGADPGGKGAFGLAFVDVSGAVRCETVSSVDEAVNTVTAVGKPLGLGIDAPMWWSASEGGGRKADARLRERYGISSGSVQSGNSLRGAALIGGALLASRLREAFPSLRITESHPKALLLALGLDETQFAARFGIEARWRNEHERDAAIAAVCTREGFEGRWSTDLAKERDRGEQNPRTYRLAPMAYFWPKAPWRDQGADFGWPEKPTALRRPPLPLGPQHRSRSPSRLPNDTCDTPPGRLVLRRVPSRCGRSPAKRPTAGERARCHQCAHGQTCTGTTIMYPCDARSSP